MIKRFVTGFAIIVVAAFILFLGASYYYVHVFMHSSKKIVINGESLYEKAKKQRQELIKTNDVETVSFTSEDGVVISGLLIKQAYAKRNIVACHGYRGAKEMLHDFIPILSDSNVLLFDFRGHGQSGDGLITFGYNEARDVRAAAKFMRKKINKDIPLVLFGVSMGGVSAIKAAADYPDICDAVISDSAYATFYSMVRRIAKRLLGHMPQSDAFKFNQDVSMTIPFCLRHPFIYLVSMLINATAGFKLMAFDLSDWVEKLQIPLFIIHSEGDDVITVKNAYKLLEAAKKGDVNSTVWIGPSANHGLLRKAYTELYSDRIKEFLNKTF
jgi:pimeloyl-ACP methyl ester carboxylesterase